MANERTPEWKGKASAKIPSLTPDQVWSCLEDFCNLHKWLPTILDTCHHLEGTAGQPGWVRYCSKSTSSDDGVKTTWAKEMLVMMDRNQRCLSYSIVDNNLGFKYYVATFKVSEIDVGSEIEWSFVADPVDGWRLEDLVSYIEGSLQSMVKQMEKVLLGDGDDHRHV